MAERVDIGSSVLHQYSAAYALDERASVQYNSWLSSQGNAQASGAQAQAADGLSAAAKAYSEALPALLQALALTFAPASRSTLRACMDACIDRVQALHRAGVSMGTGHGKESERHGAPSPLALPTVQPSIPAPVGTAQQVAGAKRRPLPDRKAGSVTLGAGSEESARHARIRAAVVAEMVNSEKSYLGHLARLVNLYVRPLAGRTPESSAELSQALGGKVPLPSIPPSSTPIHSLLTAHEHETAWPGMDALLPLHRTLHSSMEAARATHPDTSHLSVATEIANVFIKMAPFFKLAGPYCTNFGPASSALGEWRASRPALHAYLSAAEADPASCGQTLSSLMAMPVQRVPRYVLLLTELGKHIPNDEMQGESGKEALRAREAVAKALTMVQATAAALDFSVSQYERRLRVLAWQQRLHPAPEPSLVAPSRELLREGRLSKACRPFRLKQYECALLNDCTFVYATPEMLGDGLHLHGLLRVVGVQINDDTDGHGSRVPFAFKLLAQPKSVLLSASSEDERKGWVQSVRHAVAQTHSSTSSLSHSVGMGVDTEVGSARAHVPSMQSIGSTMGGSVLSMGATGTVDGDDDNDEDEGHIEPERCQVTTTGSVSGKHEGRGPLSMPTRIVPSYYDKDPDLVRLSSAGSHIRKDGEGGLEPSPMLSAIQQKAAEMSERRLSLSKADVLPVPPPVTQETVRPPVLIPVPSSRMPVGSAGMLMHATPALPCAPFTGHPTPSPSVTVGLYGIATHTTAGHSGDRRAVQGGSTGWSPAPTDWSPRTPASVLHRHWQTDPVPRAPLTKRPSEAGFRPQVQAASVSAKASKVSKAGLCPIATGGRAAGPFRWIDDAETESAAAALRAVVARSPSINDPLAQQLMPQGRGYAEQGDLLGIGCHSASNAGLQQNSTHRSDPFAGLDAFNVHSN